MKLFNISYLDEYICLEEAILNKLYNFISLYWSPSQSSDEFENFISRLDLTLEALTQKKHISKELKEGIELDNLMSKNELKQILKE